MKRLFDNCQNKHFDLIIIGGGITGVSLAYEAASSGFSVALFEKDDFGHATSAATSKLIHGGLRYLKNFEFGLVRESLGERRIWENIAPNMVYPLPFLVPTYKNLKSNKLILEMGMFFYDLLSFDKGNTWDRNKRLPSHKTLSRSTTLSLEQCIKSRGLTGSSIYYDCQNINPERLTLTVLRSAMKYGAQAADYAKVTSFIKENGSVSGVEVLDMISGQKHCFSSQLTVNCAGPWADLILKKAAGNHQNNHHIRRSEGIHIITKKICNTNAVTVMTASGRHLLLMPWRNHSLIGTTDKEYLGDPDQYKVSKESILELLQDVNENFACNPLSLNDVRHAYGGLRPLIDDQTEGSYETSRKYEIFDNNDEGLNNLITIEGGKYTTSRKLAGNAMKMICKKTGKPLKKSITDSQYLDGCQIKNLEAYIRDIQLQYPDFSNQTITSLVSNYGTYCHELLDIALREPHLKQSLTEDGEILAEVKWAIEHEMADSLCDILFRRTGIGTLGHPGQETIQIVANLAAFILNWPETRINEELAKVEETYLTA
ncbi:MAG: glycerol-3-phosphate dehydrogenase/oxidase [Bacteroidales bacterium]|nr:glycerol-3-phosphate dehydrogenase/oxidase [Bacteroidales bacterium]